MEQSYFPCGAGDQKNLLASSVVKRLLEMSSSVHTTSPAACQALPSQAQGHTALGSLSSTLQQSPHPELGKLGGKHLPSVPVALGLTCSTLEPTTTSIPEDSGHTPIPSPPESFLEVLPSLWKARLCSNKGRLNCYKGGGGGQNRIYSEMPAKLWWGQRQWFCGLRSTAACAVAFPPSADSSTLPNRGCQWHFLIWGVLLTHTQTD